MHHIKIAKVHINILNWINIGVVSQIQFNKLQTMQFYVVQFQCELSKR